MEREVLRTHKTSPALMGTWHRLYRECPLPQGAARQLPEVSVDLRADAWLQLLTLPTRVTHTWRAEYHLSKGLLKVT